MTPDEALSEIDSGTLRPVYLVVGEERHLAEAVVARLRERTLESGVAGLNDDVMTAGQDSVEDALATAKTLPMLATRRWLLVRQVERWDGEKADGSRGKPGSGEPPLERLTAYAEAPSPSTVLVLLAAKLDKRRRLYTLGKKAGFLVSADPLDRRALPGFLVERARERGCTLSRSDAALVVELTGSDLSLLTDAIERLCLYVGQGKAIDQNAISEVVTRVTAESVWELVSAVGRRDAARALAVLGDVYDASDRGLRLLGTLGWATRQLLRFDQARRAGLDSAEAAKAAGAPPFKAGELEAQVKKLSPEVLERWVHQLARTDLALKGGSRRPPEAVLCRMVLDLCQPGA